MQSSSPVDRLTFGGPADDSPILVIVAVIVSIAYFGPSRTVPKDPGSIGSRSKDPLMHQPFDHRLVRNATTLSFEAERLQK